MTFVVVRDHALLLREIGLLFIISDISYGKGAKYS